MRANSKFRGKGQDFWAHVRSLSQTLGYSKRAAPVKRPKYAPKKTKEEKLASKLRGTVFAPTFEQLLQGMDKLELFSDHLVKDGEPTAYGADLVEYFAFRAEVLNGVVRSNLMTLADAKATYQRIKGSTTSKLKETMNKQKNEKATVSFLTGMVNLLVESNADSIPCEHNPMKLTTFTRDKVPVRTLARRVDGAFPSVINPVAIWEIKEYYHTTTFGSRVSGGVYETLLDGLELEEMSEETGIKVEHLLIVDALNCWWGDGRPYLCRMIDSLHMGYVDEILFGKEVESRLPVLTKEWVTKVREQQANAVVVLPNQTSVL